jgi:16S rRNA (guanine966-N2)-methyltransferase
VTRIVGGSVGGRTLLVPANGTRPTSDRVREALFSTLDGLLELDGAHVLDLFAGSGAVGLECASRGAAAVTLVDSDREAALVLRRNADGLGLPGVKVLRQPAELFLAGHPVATYDLVFADPPYAYAADTLASVLARLVEPVGWLADDAVVVVERSDRSGPPEWPSVIQPIKHRRYGDSVLWYGRRE